MHPLIVIPARYASTRLPGKMLEGLGGLPMVLRVWERAVASKVGRVVIATDDARIFDVAMAHGAEVVMTHDHHPSGSDRVWEALMALDPGHAHDVIVNLQGDVPTLPPRMVSDVLAPLDNPACDLATLACRIARPEDEVNDAVVKPVISWDSDRIGRALYFTRLPAPWGNGERYHHIGIYAWRRAALERFVHLAPSPLEKRERLEQLRALEHGMHIGLYRVDEEPPGVDTPEQLEQIRRAYFSGLRFEQNPLF